MTSALESQRAFHRVSKLVVASSRVLSERFQIHEDGLVSLHVGDLVSQGQDLLSSNKEIDIQTLRDHLAVAEALFLVSESERARTAKEHGALAIGLLQVLIATTALSVGSGEDDICKHGMSASTSGGPG